MTALASPELLREIHRRRTFAIISHPDAGKTTITEKLLLFGNAIQMAGVVKAKKSGRFATSDWMEIEKQRGISVSSSVMQFEYGGCAFNLLDTPGHNDFSEDTFRVLTAVDSALMVIDSNKGIESQTRRLFQVCRDRNVPILTFINKMDLEGRDPFDLVAQIEEELKLPCAVMTWPIGQGGRFRGVYDLISGRALLFSPGQKTLGFEKREASGVDDPALLAHAGEDAVAKLKEDLELLHGAGHAFDREKFLAGHLSPVFFGSGVNNFGVQELLDAVVSQAPAPRPRPAESRTVSADEKNFSGLIFKIQANMDPKHRDRFAFLRVCSGEFIPGSEVHHVRLGREIKINSAVQFLSQQRHNVERAVAGDIVGIHDRGTFMIGDTLTAGEDLKFTGIPQFSPDLFCLVDLKNPIKSKQLQKGLEQLAEEGTSQLFRRKENSDSIIGVVGRLQFEVVKFRLLNEYGADAIFSPLNFVCSRWIHAEKPSDFEKLYDFYRGQVVYDVRGYPMMLFKSDWEMKYVEDKNPGVTFYASLLNYEQVAV